MQKMFSKSSMKVNSYSYKEKYIRTFEHIFCKFSHQKKFKTINLVKSKSFDKICLFICFYIR